MNKAGKWAGDRFSEDADFGKKIIFSDAAHFDLGGYVKKQSCRIWNTENHNAPKTSHCFVWILVQRHNWAIFFENKQGQAVTVNGDRYRVILNEFLFKKIEEAEIGNIWLQQDGAACHTAEATLDVLRPVFEERFISCRTDVVWPPRSYDCWTIICGLPSKISVMPTSQRQLTL